MRTKPNVIRLSSGVARLDLRSKTFDAIRNTLANGKKTLEFPTLAAAERKATEIADLLDSYGSKKLETFDSVLKTDPLALQAKLSPFGKTIQDAVEFYAAFLKEQADKQKSQTFGTLMDDWLAEKKRRVEQNTMRPATYETLDVKANGLDGYKAKWGNRPVATVTTEEIEGWIESRKVRVGGKDHYGFKPASQTSKVHQLSYLSQFFRWCKRKHGVPKENPCESITIERDDLDPDFFSPEDCQAIMDSSTSKRFLSLLPFTAVCLFAGVRTAECERLDWSNIDFEDKAIVINKADAKTRKHRRVEMQPNLVRWLKWFREKYPEYPFIPRRGFDDRKRQFRKKLGIHWAKNGLRHSYASYILGAKRGDFGYLEQNMGNSRTMLQNHYVNYPPKEVSEAFWNIVPKPQSQGDEPAKE